MTTPRRLAVLAAGIATLTLACGNQRNATLASSALDTRVCNEQDLGGGWNEETGGGFTAANLAGQASQSSERTAALVRAGLLLGHFAYWTRAASQPPFQPQSDLVCQVMQFDTAEHAAAFVRDLQPDPQSLITAGIAWLPSESRKVQEETTPGLPPAARAFLLSAANTEIAVEIHAVMIATGPFVRTVYLEAPGTPNQTQEAADILQSSIRRLP